MATYKKLVQLPNDVYALQYHTLYGAGRVGLLDKSTGKALFELSDHLGNVRAVVTASANGVAETISYTDYYPHGGTLPGRTYQSSLNFPYGYQGQEKDGATGLTNFELRQYDPRIGRWYNPDPYMQHHSPYLAMSNNPVSNVDPDGGWDGEMNGESAKDNPNNLLSTLESAQGKTWEAMSPDERATIAQATGTTYRMQDIERLMRKLDGLGIKLEATKAHPGYYGIWFSGASWSQGVGDDGTGIISKDIGATQHWVNVIKKEDLHRYRKFQDGAVGYFFHGFFDGVGKSVGGTINFIIDDAWEAETWKSFGKTLYAIALPSSSEGQMISKAIAEKASNADIYDWGDFTGQVVTAAVGTKGVGVGFSAAKNGVNVTIGGRTLSVMSKVSAPGMVGRRVLGIKTKKFTAALDYHNWVMRSAKDLKKGYGPINQKFWHYHYGSGKQAGRHMLIGGQEIHDASQLRKGLFGLY